MFTSYHEIGIYDIPANIDYILLNTNQQRLQYIGWSQGCTSYFVMASMRPEYNAKVELVSAFSPVAYNGDLFNPILRRMARFQKIAEVRKSMPF